MTDLMRFLAARMIGLGWSPDLVGRHLQSDGSDCHYYTLPNLDYVIPVMRHISHMAANLDTAIPERSVVLAVVKLHVVRS